MSLSQNDWILVVMFAGPVILLEEILKIVARAKTARELEIRMAAIHHAEKNEKKK